ncbi:MAG: hypothetical protein F2808_07290 [Actinobacteria bacterium]|uniref:Unannotated protein n=1 Tax=freshwater metagenome TaxID=449393 RepID=A0A6J7GZX8_9ZZZZ|nr:hypothetical protein [Actinomycetota bacterium]
MKIETKKLRLLIPILGTALALSGCSANSTSDLTSTPAQSTAAQREAQNRGSRLCVVNSTSLQMRVQWRGYPAPRDVSPGHTDCNSGYETTQVDVLAAIEYEPADQPGKWLTLNAFAENIFLGPPRAAAWFESQGSQLGACGKYYVNDEDSFQTNKLHVKIVRIDDTASNKEFVLTLTEPSGQDSAPDVSTCIHEKINPL